MPFYRMKLVFWLLDINYEFADSEPEIRLWGISEEGRRVLVIHRGFYSYFYVVPKQDMVQETMEKIENMRGRLSQIVGTEIVERKYFGKPLKVIKVVCKDPAVLEDYAKKISKLEQVERCLEYDIRYSMKYMVDNEVSPCSWHELEVEEVKEGPNAQVDAVYLAKEVPRKVERESSPELRVLAFYPIYYSKRGSPKPERDPVIMIATLNSSGEAKIFVSNGDDSEVIRGFTEYVREYDPDVIVGFESNQKHLLYLKERSKTLGVDFSITRTGTEIHTSAYGHISITGRANVDLYDFVEDIAAIKLKTLENVAEYFGVERPRRIREYEIPSYWDDPSKRKELKEYAAECSRSIMGVASSILDFAIQLSELVGIPLDHVGTAAVGFKVEWYLIKEAHKRGELVPERVERPYRPYPGAIVLEPKPGRHEKIAVLDFKSMYPSIMIAYNVSPDTYVPPEEIKESEDYYIAPEVNHAFRKEPPGFYKEVLSELLKARNQIREKLKSLDPESPEYRALDARQKALKVIANASYGYSGWIGARWYIKPVAEATTAWGRATIRQTISIAKEMGLELIYGDTDSIFVKYEPDKVKSFLKSVGEKLRMEIKVDKVYERVIFTEAKKRYAGLLPD
ncbi:MAG TPA: DNA polymerase II [Candidatus Korarchaeota archaeon]|nr:DNA polymerase II [Candidatus Korarchaeota archaeon]